ncbi:carbohydrate kinase [Chakrabartyella piscis]|uniref:carbohydrate kinase family protein n=1 Tax=Chakrabartyella piscis TaxID=2918914 RepID=UPI0029588B7D|nr:carbohydrate kinase [Chakrabartyella piscis]
MIDITALGEILIDFTYNGISKDGQKLFEQNPGGAPANMLASANKCGMKTAFVGKVGNDMHGEFMMETLKSAGIDTSNLLVDDSAFTTLAFVGIDANGERNFSFARKPGADTLIKPEEVSLELLKNSRVFHFGGLSLPDEPSASATRYAIQKAKELGCIVTYDPNYRPSLWRDDVERAVREMKEMIPHTDLMKVSDEELVLMTGQEDIEVGAKMLLAEGTTFLVVTLGGDGAYVCNASGGAYVAGYKSQVVDTTGAGDSFFGAFVSEFLKSGKKPEEITIADGVEFARFGNAVASLCVEKRGGIPSMPEFSDSKARYETMK